jgi:PncC family amidohydrolase
LAERREVTPPRAAIVASGSELVRGDRFDRNGPFLAASLLRLGVEPARIAVVGDGEADLEAALRDGFGFDLLCVSSLHLDTDLAAQIEALSRRVAERLGRPYTDFAHGVDKQATLPEGAQWVGLVGTAPAVVLEVGSCVVVALPGPPRELQELWPRVLDTEPLRRVLVKAHAPERRVLRFYGVSESAVAQALAAAGGDGNGVDVTICARETEMHVDLFVSPGAEARADELEAKLVEPVAGHLFSREEIETPALVLQLLREQGLTLATAESCTGGMVAARLTAIPGSSDVFLGSIVAYADAVKAAQLGVPEDVLATYGAVSAETARAMAEGARERLGADVAVSVTGVAGPEGGTPEKPVGLVFLHAAGPQGERTLRFDFPGDRDTIRGRAAVAALHLVRRLVTDS